MIQGDNITVTYNDRSNAAGAAQTITKIIDVDPDPPTFTNITPSDGSSTNDLTAELSVEVSDTIGGVNPKSVVFSVGVEWRRLGSKRRQRSDRGGDQRRKRCIQRVFRGKPDCRG